MSYRARRIRALSPIVGIVSLILTSSWWVVGSWGLGLSGSFGFHSLPDGDVDENWSGTSYALRFSATMN